MNEKHKIDLARFLKFHQQNPNDITTLYEMAKIYEAENSFQQAISIYQKIIKIDQSRPEVFFNLGLILKKSGRLDAAINAFSLSIKIAPLFYQSYIQLAELYEQKSDIQRASDYYTQVLKFYPDSQEILNDYGLFLKRNNLLERSETIFHQLTQLFPETAKYHGNLANVQQKQLKTKEAMEEYNRAIALEPNYYEAIFSRSLALLQKGDYKSGWRDYETRWQLPYFNMRNLEKSLWQGEDIQSKKLLVWAEQGFGDTIQMYRFLPLLKQKNIYIIFECQKELFPLFEKNKKSDELNLVSETRSNCYDYHLPMMSLPYLLGIDNDNIYDREGYLKVDKSASKFIAGDPKLKIGFVWKGNIKFSNDINRSVNPKYFLPLIQRENIQFYSLQYGKNNELAGLPEVIDLSSNISDFLDTAQIINQMDLIISVDTAIAHLAGALGKKTFLILPYSPDWRWGLGTSESCWYDSIKIFRQKNPGDWDSIFTQITSEFNNF